MSEATAGEPTGPAPRVSIGLPVYNGENFLAEALDSILAQTFTDFELIISDNCSTDATEDICRRYAEKDDRIRYYRQAKNLGAAPNYNFTFEKARGHYFKWSAHDDVMLPEWLERCVDVLDRNPDVELAYSRTLRIDEHTVVQDEYEIYGSMRLMSARPSVRFGDMICMQHNCVPIFALGRRDVFATTDLKTKFQGSDRYLLADFALRGKVFLVPEPLFLRREHGGAYSDALTKAEKASWWDTADTRTVSFPHWRALRTYLGHINRADLTKGERWACYRQMVRWVIGPTWYRQRWVKLIRDGVVGSAELAKQKVATRSFRDRPESKP